MPRKVLIVSLLCGLLLSQFGCWQRVAVARGVKRVESGDGPVGQMVNQLGDDEDTGTYGGKTTTTTSSDTAGGAY